MAADGDYNGQSSLPRVPGGHHNRLADTFSTSTRSLASPCPQSLSSP